MLAALIFRLYLLTFFHIWVFPKAWSTVCSLYLDISSWPLCILCCLEKRATCFRALDYSVSEPNRSVSIFKIGADHHHAVYNNVTVTSKHLVHIRKYIQVVTIKETAVEVLFGSSCILGWMESSGLHSKIQQWQKKDLCNLGVDGLLFDLIEMTALLNKSFILVSNQKYNAIRLDLGKKVMSFTGCIPSVTPCCIFFLESSLLVYLGYILHSLSCWIRAKLMKQTSPKSNQYTTTIQKWEPRIFWRCFLHPLLSYSPVRLISVSLSWWMSFLPYLL